MGNVLGDPFALATISIGMVGSSVQHPSTKFTANHSLQLAWLIAFIGTIVATVEVEGLSRFPWWAVIFNLFLTVGVFVVVASDTVHTYHVAVSTYSGVGLVLASTAVNALIYGERPAMQAAAAGFILLCMVTVRTCLIAYQCDQMLTPTTRLHGSSTLGRHPRPRQELSLTPSLSPRSPLPFTDKP